MNGYASTVGGGAMTSVAVRQEKKKAGEGLAAKAEKPLRTKTSAIRKPKTAKKKAA